MEAAVLLWFHLLLSVIFCNGFHVQGPSGPLTVQLGDSVMLPCFVETPLPMEELEVEWKRTDSGSLVHLWQNGESRPESQNRRYHERAHFFSEEVAHGNFSLLLTNVTREDAGVYKCVVHTNQHSDETLIEIMETERLIVSGAHVISAYAGEEITLNCSVDSHIPSEKIEEVSWKKQDEDLLVLLYQEGEILTESTHGRFKDRVEFFSAEDRNKGNFSMRLKDVRTEDKGLYICLAFSGDLSDNTTVEVQQLGFSSMHIGIFVLCILGFIIGSVILGYFSYTSLKKKNNSRRARVIQCAHVLCPNITLSIVFILWGVTEGLFTEAATCSALNLVRILSLFWITDHLKLFQGSLYQLMSRLAFPLQYVVITAVAYLHIIVDFCHKTNTAGKAIILTPFLVIFLLHAIKAVYFRILRKVTHSSYGTTEFSNLLRIFVILWIYGSRTLENLTVLLFPLLGIIFYFFFRCLKRGALTLVTVFLYILTMMTLFSSLKRLAESNSRNTWRQPTRSPDSNSRNTVIQPSVWSVVVFMIGSVLVVFVNVAALLVELILKARNGQRTVDLRVILIPTECVFAMCWLTLQMSAFWKKNRNRLRKDIKSLRECCGCKRKQMDSNSHQPDNEHELQNLQNTAPELSGS